MSDSKKFHKKPCKYFFNCNRRGCTNSHRPGIPCPNLKNCHNPRCDRYHPPVSTKCKYGDKCKNHRKVGRHCLYIHDDKKLVDHCLCVNSSGCQDDNCQYFHPTDITPTSAIYNCVVCGTSIPMGDEIGCYYANNINPASFVGCSCSTVPTILY